MSLHPFIHKIKSGEKVDFADTLAIIAEHYTYQPTEFSNGLGDTALINSAGVNEGSCKLFAFAKLHALTQAQTLSLFGDYYWVDVLGHPGGADHQNIRNFIKNGWEGITFKGDALLAKE